MAGDGVGSETVEPPPKKLKFKLMSLFWYFPPLSALTNGAVRIYVEFQT
jgi:hypothetical protein